MKNMRNNMNSLLITIPMSFLMLGCSAKSERECYEANYAVANAIDKSITAKNQEGFMKSQNEWAATHIAAMKWRATVCKE
jgi:hypothetical protein